MSDKGLYSPVVRRIITIITLFGIIGSFIAVYYFVYVPQERTRYNLRNFRILHEISNNFKDRIDNYGNVYFSRHNSVDTGRVISAAVIDRGNTSLRIDSFFKSRRHSKKVDSLIGNSDSAKFNYLFRSSFTGTVIKNDSFTSVATISPDTISYELRFKIAKPVNSISEKPNKTSRDSVLKKFDSTQSLEELLKPALAVHLSTFESFLLVKQSADSGKKSNGTTRYDKILYKTDNSYIANINTDSLFKNKFVQAPVIADLVVEGVAYKMYLFPFKIKSDETYVLVGIIPNTIYNSESQNVPVDLLSSLCFVLIVLLLALPFLKIFFLSSEETVTLRDVRTIILVIYATPVFVLLLCALIWMSTYTKQQTVNTLQSLQNNVQQNFYREISQCLLQLRDYDKIAMNAFSHLDTTAVDKMDLSQRSKIDLNKIDTKDIVFYPKYYRGLTSLQWMNSEGENIAAWNWIAQPATYFDLHDRQYFKDIKYNHGLTLPDSAHGLRFHNPPPNIDTMHFSIQPVLSRLTGEYVINLAMQSADTIIRQTPDKRDSASAVKALAIGLSSKMYSLWNTVVPKGFAFCLIDESGQVLAHSDTTLSLEENIFQESGDSLLLRSVISHKDSALLNDEILYDEPVRMIIKPLPGWPYYLVTYAYKRSEYLFILHVLAFVFMCISTLLLLISLFSYLMMLSDKKLSLLFYKNNGHDWLKPLPDKKHYYIKIILQSLLVAFIIWLPSETLDYDNYILYSVNAAVLLPLFGVTGYYLIKKSKDYFEKNPVTTKRRSIKTSFFYITYRLPRRRTYRRFGEACASIFALYILSLALFLLLQNTLFINKDCDYTTRAIIFIFILMLVVPVIMFLFAGIYIVEASAKRKQAKNIQTGTSYLTLFITALLLSVSLVGVAPTVALLNYSFREEKVMRLQSLQVNLAKKIQQRRLSKNTMVWQTKMNLPLIADTVKNAFLSDMKLKDSNGIYLPDSCHLDTIKHFTDESEVITSCSPFYKKITQYLFLPPDHDEFYDDSTHRSYYNWQYAYHKTGLDTLGLFYKNLSDNRDSSSIKLTSIWRHDALFHNFTGNNIGWLLLLVLLVFASAFCLLILSATKRIFLIGFFNESTQNSEDASWLKERYDHVNLRNLLHHVFDENQTVSFASIRNEENKDQDGDNNGEEKIIALQLSLTPIYEAIWSKLSDIEKYTLYDFATDGFTNYKQFIILYGLRKKGLLYTDENYSLTIMTKSFRNFLMTKDATPEIKKLSSEGRKGSWGLLRTVFYVVLIAVAIFIFLSQEEASKQLITIITSFGALLPAILKLFDKSTFSSGSADGAKK